MSETASLTGGMVRRLVAFPLGPETCARVATSLSGGVGVAASAAWFWLDGEASQAPGVSSEPRVSYLGAASEVIEAEPGLEREFLDLLVASPTATECHGAVNAVATGWVVALSYELGVALMGLTPAPDSASPAFALRTEVVLRVDHDRGTAELTGPNEGAIDTWLEAHGWAFDSAPGPGGSPDATAHAERARSAPALWSRGDDQYLADVDACQAAIHRGDAYVLCLTDTAHGRSGRDPLSVFLDLRAQGPALRGGVISVPGRALVSLSPERFLSLHGGKVATHPIKGTVSRKVEHAADEHAAESLLTNPKERAENLMIVDLMRNDLSRVCAPGSVRVDGFLRVESHPRVHQLVSTVTGELAAGRNLVDVLVSCFPGGSMTGAPKNSAVEILASLEGAPRGLYSGCFGWIDAVGNAELAMTIRSIEMRHEVSGDGDIAETTWRIGAGGGITADSIAPYELAERDLKAAPLRAALTA